MWAALFAEWDIILALLSGMVAAIVTAGPVIYGFIKGRQEARAKARADALLEWKDWSGHLEERIAVLEVDHRACQQKLGEADVRNTRLEGEIRLLQTTMQRVQRITGDDMPTSLAAVVIADTDGVIRSASPAVGPLLHYLPGELIGKNVSILVSERDRPQHLAEIAKVKELGHIPWSERIVLGTALTKEGEEVAVSVRLSSWLGSKGQWYLSAEIARRHIPDSGAREL
jgi:PAS domain S-box-containing protein